MPEIIIGLGDGRKRPRGLRNWVLHILESAPMNGAEIMEQMDLLTRGLWRPSPGSIYPLLEQLAEEQLVKKRSSDGRYELTDLARGAPLWMFGIGRGTGSARDPETVLHEVESYVRLLEDLAGSDPGRMIGLRDRLKIVSQRIDRLARDGAGVR